MRLSGAGQQEQSWANAPISAQQTYDALGNLCSKRIDGAVQAYTYAGAAGCGLNSLPGSGSAGAASE